MNRKQVAQTEAAWLAGLPQWEAEDAIGGTDSDTRRKIGRMYKYRNDHLATALAATGCPAHGEFQYD